MSNAIDLCTIDDVRVASTDNAAWTDDRTARATGYITQASSLIMRESGREFRTVFGEAGDGVGTRSFQHRGGDVLSFDWCCDLAALTSAVINGEAIETRFLTLNPAGNVWTALELRDQSWRSDSWCGTRQVDVAGTWGFPTVPPEIVRACADTVNFWIRQSSYQGAVDMGGGLVAPGRSFALPGLAIDALSTWRRTR